MSDIHLSPSTPKFIAMKKLTILLCALCLTALAHGQVTMGPDDTVTVVFEYDGAGNRIARRIVTGQPETGRGDESVRTTGENGTAEAKLPDDTDIDERQSDRNAV